MNTNQIIHERLMGECWHEKGERSKDDFYKNYCSKCGKLTSFYTCNEGVLCSESPRYCENLNQCFAAQAKAIERFGLDSFVVRLAEIVYNGRLPKIVGMGKVIGASAADRCAAIVKLLENGK